MRKKFSSYALFVLAFLLLFAAVRAEAQLGSSGSMEGVVKDPSGSVVPGATVEISYPVSGFRRTAATDADGNFKFTNVPFNPYHFTVTAPGFAPFAQDVDVRSAVPVTLQITLRLGESSTSITVEASGADLIETQPSAHTDVDTGA
jgi:Carboxypeptidase regulatory-like domain